MLTLSPQNPTYEDMLLLSSLLGPAKPPVASHEDVASASGTFLVQRNGDSLIAAALKGSGRIQIAPRERCLVCLEDYRAAEELRQLTKCSHLFHRECIDQVNYIIISFRSSYQTNKPFSSGLLQGATRAHFVEVRGSTKKKRVSQKINSRLQPERLK